MSPETKASKMPSGVFEVLHIVIKSGNRGTWVTQSVECPTLAQVMISQFVSSSPTSGSVPMAQSLEPALDSVSPSLSALPHSCSVSLKKK